MIGIAIVGGGVSGLWLLNRLRALGYDAHLFEKEVLGAGQTMAGQGIIHSGAKYGLAGAERDPLTELAQMPDRWKKCLAGNGEIDLRGVKVYGEQMLFRLGDVYPFAGEPVLDVRSLLESLLRPVWQWCYLGPPVEAKLTIWTAGMGNEAVSTARRRPLRMFMVRPNPFGSPVYVHWTGKNDKPMMTVTTHYLGDQEVLYLGGNVAEKAVGMGDAESIEWAISEAQYRFPNFNWRKREWAFVDLVRAEGGSEPILKQIDDRTLAAWPFKLSLAPVLADRIIAHLESVDFPKPDPFDQAYVNGLRFERLCPQIAQYPWKTARWVTP